MSEIAKIIRFNGVRSNVSHLTDEEVSDLAFCLNAELTERSINPQGTAQLAEVAK